jgi:nicotinamidase-related amidase
VRHTAADAFFRGYRVVIPEDCVQAFTEEAHTSGLEYVKFWYKADTTDSKALIESWR